MIEEEKKPTTVDAFPETFCPVPPGVTPSWFTDRGWFLGLERELLADQVITRPFDCDPCGHLRAPVSQEILSRGGTVWTIEDDGLVRPWRDRVLFVNPPYDCENLDRWGARMVQQLIGGGRPAGMVALLPAWTDRSWWHHWIEPYRLNGVADVRFVEGRLSFGWPDNPVHLGADSAKFASCTVRWNCQGAA